MDQVEALTGWRGTKSHWVCSSACSLGAAEGLESGARKTSLANELCPGDQTRHGQAQLPGWCQGGGRLNAGLCQATREGADDPWWEMSRCFSRAFCRAAALVAGREKQNHLWDGTSHLRYVGVCLKSELS